MLTTPSTSECFGATLLSICHLGTLLCVASQAQLSQVLFSTFEITSFRLAGGTGPADGVGVSPPQSSRTAAWSRVPDGVYAMVSDDSPLVYVVGGFFKDH